MLKYVTLVFSATKFSDQLIIFDEIRSYVTKSTISYLQTEHTAVTFIILDTMVYLYQTVANPTDLFL